jgi:hypothetical protein
LYILLPFRSFVHKSVKKHEKPLLEVKTASDCTVLGISI